MQLVDDPIVNWRYVPKSEIKTGKVVTLYNGVGFRDVEHQTEKPRGIKRVVVLGDSVTEGYGVEWESVFSHFLQTGLGPGYEVITIAMSGLNTPQEVHILERTGLPYKPDIVVLNFVLNDCDFYTNFHDAKRYFEKVDSTVGILNLRVNPRLKQLLKSSALIYFIKERLENLKGRLWGEETTDYFTTIWKNEQNRQKVRTGFDKLQELQQKEFFKVIVTIWPIISDYNNYKFESIHEWVRHEAESRGFEALDLLDQFSRFSYRELQVTAEDNIHPNGLGHRIGAEAFLAWYYRSLKSPSAQL